MALSPYAVYLSQEARHYTLAMIWMTLSYGCVAKIIQAQQRSHKIPFQVLLGWLIVNTLGVASHYFMVLSLFAEGLVFTLLLWSGFKKKLAPKISCKNLFPRLLATDFLWGDRLGNCRFSAAQPLAEPK